jgi:hypothetical protein
MATVKFRGIELSVGDRFSMKGPILSGRFVVTIAEPDYISTRFSDRPGRVYRGGFGCHVKDFNSVFKGHEVRRIKPRGGVHAKDC